MLGHPEGLKDLRDKLNRDRSRCGATISNVESRISTETSIPPSECHVGIGQEELNRVKKEIFNQVKTELEARGRRPTTLYKPSKIAQEPFMARILVVELPKRFKGLHIDKYDGSTDPMDHTTSYHDDIRQVG